MSSELRDRVERALASVHKEMILGERITLQITEACVCNANPQIAEGDTLTAGDKPRHKSKCHLCGGKGWIFDSLTLRGKEAGP